MIADDYLPMSEIIAKQIPLMLQEAPAQTTRVKNRVQANLTALHAMLNADKNGMVSVLRAEGGWNVLLRVPSVLDENELVLAMIERHGISGQPGYFFDMTSNGYLAISLLPESDDANENGLIIAVSQDDFEAFILGDAPSKAEKALIASAPMPDAEVLFVAHHGSNTSTCKELLEAITPETAVISVGYNTYGHPTQKVLDRLAKYEITVLRTDTDGEITIAAGEG